MLHFATKFVKFRNGNARNFFFADTGQNLVYLFSFTKIFVRSIVQFIQQFSREYFTFNPKTVNSIYFKKINYICKTACTMHGIRASTERDRALFFGLRALNKHVAKMHHLCDSRRQLCAVICAVLQISGTCRAWHSCLRVCIYIGGRGGEAVTKFQHLTIQRNKDNFSAWNYYNFFIYFYILSRPSTCYTFLFYV